MKKYFYLAAVSAMMLTACSNDEAISSSPEPVQEAPQAVAFDTYVPGTTRAGTAGVITTDKLKTAEAGFGVFAYYQDNGDYTTGLTPNFMYNQHISWNKGWTYSPLKYWPNETGQDSQTDPATSSTNTDKLSFFAYAPYVNLTTTGTMTVDRESSTPTTTAAYVESSSSGGILSISKESVTGDPLVEWKAASDLSKNVDLLWGVAPAGMSYQSVNPGISIIKTAGLPLLDMVKPDKDQKMKFLFQHALSRIGFSVVSSIDKISEGDDANKFATDDNTRVLIDKVVIYGNKIGKQGVLNLNNTSKAANWIEASVDRTASDVNAPMFTISTENGYLAPALRYEPSQITAVNSDATTFSSVNAGVLPSEQTLMINGDAVNPNSTVTNPSYAFGQVLYTKNTSGAYEVAKANTPATTKVYSKDASGNYTKVSDGNLEVDGTTQYYTLTGADAPITSGTIKVGESYWTLSGNVFTKVTVSGSDRTSDGTEYLLTETPVTATYNPGTYYTGMPRYFMVIPSKALDPSEISVKITYHVVTLDTKLTGNISNVSNTITKTTSIQLENGKSYNLKLILGLTSVKLEATVADWQLADDTEIWVPKNNE